MQITCKNGMYDYHRYSYAKGEENYLWCGPEMCLGVGRRWWTTSSGSAGAGVASLGMVAWVLKDAHGTLSGTRGGFGSLEVALVSWNWVGTTEMAWTPSFFLVYTRTQELSWQGKVGRSWQGMVAWERGRGVSETTKVKVEVVGRHRSSGQSSVSPGV